MEDSEEFQKGDEVSFKVQQSASKTATRRSTLTVALVVTALIVVVGIVLIAIAVAVGITLSEDDSDTDSESVCLTAECEELSALVVSGIDENIDPCEDFYNFTCGNWVESNFDSANGMRLKY